MLTWALAHPWMTLAITALAIEAIAKIATSVVRHWNIAARGWPPVHLDADGDFRAEEEAEERSVNTEEGSHGSDHRADARHRVGRARGPDGPDVRQHRLGNVGF